MEKLLEIDGSAGGGQVLRTALSLSMITGRPFCISGIRGLRTRPGLMRQHLTAVQAAAQITDAHTVGAELNSTNLVFHPNRIIGGNYSFAIGTAGSTTLVMQTLIPALLTADTRSTIRVSGGTHNPAAPTFEFIQRAWLPLLRRMGANIEIDLVQRGFAPAGGGVLEARISPSTLTPLHLGNRSGHSDIRVETLISATTASVASRELDRVATRLKLGRREMTITDAGDARGPGHVLCIECEHAQGTGIFTSVGRGRAREDQIADEAIDDYLLWATSSAAVSHRLADQLLLPMALAGGGSFTTDRLSGHLGTNIGVIERFLPARISALQEHDHVAVSFGGDR